MEEQSWFDTFIGWIATGLLWFVYLMLFVMAIGATYAIVVSKRRISWLGVLLLAFFYTIILGRWWDYTYTLIALSVIFVLTKVALTLK